ncbi:MAG TPA: type IIL restriction-modification enzyme MmeI [Tepidisphaeraceae bacterium]|nr:type IIL restriction-modification enzyme MmeI [Tepidisphaeraceae bacterium]
MSSSVAPENQEQLVADFVRRWQESGAGERANFQSFIHELCDLLGVPRPNPTRPDDRDNAYVFERAVQFDDGDGNVTTNFIDLYKRGCFVMEAKQGSSADEAPNLFDLDAHAKHERGTAVREPPRKHWDAALRRLLRYSLPTD